MKVWVLTTMDTDAGQLTEHAVDVYASESLVNQALKEVIDHTYFDKEHEGYNPSVPDFATALDNAKMCDYNQGNWFWSIDCRDVNGFVSL